MDKNDLLYMVLFSSLGEQYLIEKIKEEDNSIKKKDIIDALINFLTEKKRIGSLNSETFSLESFVTQEGEDTFLNYINEKADFSLSKEQLEEIATNSDPEKIFWNESLASSIRTYLNNFPVEQENVPLLKRNGQVLITVKDLKEADAAQSFSQKEDYVIPRKNFDNKIYYEVRDTDLVKSVAESNKNLQFTSEDDNEWIRLIMPKNTRRVEVEDLNRNFWVIAQTLSATCSYLFGEEAPIPDTFKNIFNELTQLWENVFHLWLNIIIETSSSSDKPYIDFIPIPESKYLNTLKYDNFILTSIKETGIEEYKQEIINRLSFYKQKYPKRNLCIFFYNRINNYKKNYFSGISKMGVYLYKVNTQEEKVIFFKIGDGNTNFEVDLQYNVPADIRSSLFAAKELDQGISIFRPFSLVNEIQTDEPERYYASMRIIPDFEIEFKNNEFNFKKIEFKFEDCIRRTMTSNVFVYDFICTDVNDKVEEFIFTDQIERKSYKKVMPYKISGGNKYYFGETLSWYDTTGEKATYSIKGQESFVDDGVLIKIGNFLPKEQSSRSNFTDQTNSGEKTNYALNITLIDEENGRGPGNPYTPEECYFFTPQYVYEEIDSETVQYFTYKKIDGLAPNNNKYYYAYNEVTLSNLVEIGLNSISSYIEREEVNENITSFISAIGIRPWGGTGADEPHQHYWIYNLLCGVYYFIPIIFFNTTDEISILFENTNYREIRKNGNTIGYLIYKGEINRTEYNFGKVNEYLIERGNTRWRIPKMSHEDNLISYAKVEDSHEKTFYVKLTNQDLINYKQTGSWSSLEEKINNGQRELLTKNQALTEVRVQQLSNCKGVWSVFDGNESNIAGNIHFYNNKREVAYANYLIDDQVNFSLRDKQARKANVLNFSADNQLDLWSTDYILGESSYKGDSWVKEE